MPMSAVEHKPELWSRLCRHGGARLVLLVVCLVVLIGFVAFRDPWDTAVEEIPSARPSREAVLSYLDGKSVTPTDAAGTPGRATPFTLARGKIESLRIRGDDHLAAAIKFLARTDGGTYAVEAVIDLHPTDGTYAFVGLRVLSASRR
jgi:hypothetical protein